MAYFLVFLSNSLEIVKIYKKLSKEILLTEDPRHHNLLIFSVEWEFLGGICSQGWITFPCVNSELYDVGDACHSFFIFLLSWNPWNSFCSQGTLNFSLAHIPQFFPCLTHHQKSEATDNILSVEHASHMFDLIAPSQPFWCQELLDTFIWVALILHILT
jgi:hypothetical protein